MTPATYDDLDPRTPVLIGVGEASERIDEADYRARSEVALAADAVQQAAEDTGADAAAVLRAVDLAAMTRSFDAMGLGSPLGTVVNPPWAVLHRVGAKPARVVYEALGGQTPQSLVNDVCQQVADGVVEVALVMGADVTSTNRHFTRGAGRDLPRPDFSDDADGPVEDRGRGTHLVNTRHQVLHGMTNAPVQYALLENARRHRLGLTRGEYAEQMAALLAPMSRVAARHPHTASDQVRTPAEVAADTPDNRWVAEPYRRLMVARDQVNQGAACLVASVEAARRLDVPEERWVFLHGHASLVEQPFLERPALDQGPATVAAVRHALDRAGVRMSDLAAVDLYSCFPIAVTTVTDAFDLDVTDPERLTVTGGLPFFGGAGSNYSMHAIAEVVRRVRATPGAVAMVGANGGQLSKYAVGVYAAEPRDWVADDSAAVQRALDAAPSVGWTEQADGPASIESWSVQWHRDGRRDGVVVARDLAGRRFLALVDPGDRALLDRLTGADGTDDPVGSTVHARHVDRVNRVAGDRATLDRLHPRRRPDLQRAFERVSVTRRDTVLEAVLARPTLDVVAHDELDEVVDAYLADPTLRALVLAADGPDFCRGLDLDQVGWGHTAVTPPHGVAGLTGRGRLGKPVVAAVAGSAYDAGLELLLACHLVVADETATFELSQPWRGMLAEHGALQRLPAAVGQRLADDLVLTGRRLTAQEALTAGLVSRVVPAGTHLEQAHALASRVAQASPVSLRASLRGADDAGVSEVTFSDDLLEGLAAHRKGRAPRFPGR